MPVIKINGLSKKFKVYFDKGQSLKERILFRNRNHYEDRWVLNEINLEVERGESIGLIGENGCGKSTLLKMMCKILYPDKGEIYTEGRISSLIELGAGFHPDMTGRENIYTNASILGLTKKEINGRLDQIIGFSELEDFMDNPVRTYSSGMYMRLAFSVAINVDADILLIDEILAVGDANFQMKCFDKLRELKSAGVTIIIVTHDTGTIEKFCNKAVWIQGGKIERYGESSSVIERYLSYMNHKKIDIMESKEEKAPVSEETVEETDSENVSADAAPQIHTNENHYGLKYIEIEHVNLKDGQGIQTNILKGGEPFEIEIFYKVREPLTEYIFGMGFYTLEGICIMGANTHLDNVRIPHTKKNGMIRFKTDCLALLTGKYFLQLAIVDRDYTPMDYYKNYCTFEVVNSSRSVGLVHMAHEWSAL